MRIKTLAPGDVVEMTGGYVARSYAEEGPSYYAEHDGRRESQHFDTYEEATSWLRSVTLRCGGAERGSAEVDWLFAMLGALVLAVVAIWLVRVGHGVELSGLLPIGPLASRLMRESDASSPTVNDHPWLTHAMVIDAISAPLGLDRSRVLWLYADESESVGAIGLAVDLRQCAIEPCAVYTSPIGPSLALEAAASDGIRAIDERAARLAYVARSVIASTSPRTPWDEITARLYGRYVTLQRCDWEHMADSMRDGAEYREYVRSIATRPVD